METLSKNEIWNTSYHFSLADANADGGWGHAMDLSISLTKSSNPIFGIIMIGFEHSFFSWIGI
jgi:hypothetical protein